jgi:hypothetical protein
LKNSEKSLMVFPYLIILQLFLFIPKMRKLKNSTSKEVSVYSF